MPRRPAVPAVPARPQPPQLELFPEPVDVEAVDPRRAAGERTRVRGIYRVRFGRERGAHRVFADRHGWYCEDHGPRCRAVEAARGWAGVGG